MRPPKEILDDADRVVSLACKIRDLGAVDTDNYWFVNGMVRMEVADAKVGGAPDRSDAAASASWDAALMSSDVAFTPDAPTKDQAELLSMLSRNVLVARATRGLADPVREFADTTTELIESARPAAGGLRGALAGGAKRAAAEAAAAELERALEPLLTRRVPESLAQSVADLKGEALKGDAVWSDYRAHSDEYEAAMDRIGRPTLTSG